jgi:tetraacyldisaccharide 4'-kinase
MNSGLKPVPALLPLSWVYGALMKLRNGAYNSGIMPQTSVRARVISVGNMTAGGTGKTPFVEYTVRKLLEWKKRVAIVSRGYGRAETKAVAFGPSDRFRGSAALLGDELFQIGKKFPAAAIIADANRERAAERASKEFGADVIVLDDGFQRRSLKRDLDIVLIDAGVQLRSMHMIPAGFRREPMSGLRRANVLAYTRVLEGQQLEPFPEMEGALKLQVRFEPVGFRSSETSESLPLESLKERSCLGFCGIGSPESFRGSLTDVGLNVIEYLAFADHHQYNERDIERISAAVSTLTPQVVVTTEKDMARLSAMPLPENIKKKLYVLDIATKILKSEAEFLELLRARIA